MTNINMPYIPQMYFAVEIYEKHEWFYAEKAVASMAQIGTTVTGLTGLLIGSQLL